MNLCLPAFQDDIVKHPFINWASFEYRGNFVDNSNIYTSRASARSLNMAECKRKAWNQWAIYVHLNPKSPEPRCRHDPDTPHRDPRWNSQINPVKDTACAGGKNILTGWENSRGGFTLELSTKFCENSIYLERASTRAWKCLLLLSFFGEWK